MVAGERAGAKSDSDYFCKMCNGPLKLGVDARKTNEHVWRCCNFYKKYEKSKFVTCNNTVELRYGTFFARSQLSISQILGFANPWVSNAFLMIIGEQLEISPSTAVDWSSFCWEVVFNGLIQNKVTLGGAGVIDEIDESKFGKKKCHHGHHVEGQWVFGGYERGSGRILMVCEEDRLVIIYI